jgi:hypothetical protein
VTVLIRRNLSSSLHLMMLSCSWKQVQNFILFGGRITAAGWITAAGRITAGGRITVEGRPCLFFSGVALMVLIVEVDGFELS